MVAVAGDVRAHAAADGSTAPVAPAAALRFATAAAVVVGVVLRLWALGSRPLNLDESFEALTARRGVGALPGFLARYDTMPPLSYLLRAPFLAVDASTTMARVPSALASIAALALFAFWMRRRGVLGVSATALFAVNGFLVHYGREARMYAFLELVGVAAAMTADTWLRTSRRGAAYAASGIGLAAVFLHVESLFLLAGLFCVAGLRRDREAWRWRAAVSAPVLVFAVAWGWALIRQTAHDHQPGRRTSAGALVDVVGSLVTSTTGLRLAAALAVAAGAMVLAHRHPVLGRTWAACVLVPIVLAAVVAVRLDILLPRFFAVAAWGPIVAVAALVEAAATRRAVLGVAAGLVAIVCTLPAGVDAPGYTGPAARAVTALEQRSQPGDAVMVRPFWLGYLVEWNLGARDPVLTVPRERLGLADTYVVDRPGGPPSGRVWLLEPADASADLGGRRTCAPEWTDGVSRVRCLRASP